MKKSKIIITVLGVFFLLGGLAVGLYLVGQKQILTKKAAPASSMYVMPPAQTKAPGDNFTFSIDIDTGTTEPNLNQVNSFDIRISFDPSIVQILSLQKGADVPFSDADPIFNTFDNSAGTIRYALYTSDASKIIEGTGKELLQVNAKVLPGAVAGSYNINITGSIAGDINETQNLLITLEKGLLTVSGSASSPTPTPTATAGGGANPTSTATATATATSRSNATATPTIAGGVGGAGSPTRTATARPTSTAGTSLPDTGTSWPTVAGMGLGVLVIIGSLLLAL